MAGIFYLVSTPIGNLEDITFRAVRILKEVDLIACEDTRVTAHLLQHYQIKKPLLSYFEHNKDYRARHLIAELLTGKNIALVSNAGTPLISDPGYELVRQCIEHNIRIIAVPGVSALIMGLSISGLPTDRFIFEGFLPLKPGKRRKRLEAMKTEERTIIIYESPHRIHQTLALLLQTMGNRRITLARELTKFYEEIKHGLIEDIQKSMAGKQVKGEITLVIAGNQDQ